MEIFGRIKSTAVEGCDPNYMGLGPISATKKALERAKLSMKDIDIVFHAAAYKHVNILQDNVMSAVKNNILGTVTLCNLSIKFKTDFLLISTDKAAQPKSMLGYTKKISEMYCEYLGSFRNDKKFINIVKEDVNNFKGNNISLDDTTLLMTRLI